MTCKTACSTNAAVADCAAELASALASPSVRLVVYFASAKYDAADLAAAMQERFAPIEVIGCTTAGEIVSGAMLKGSVVAMALDDEALDDVCVAVVPHLTGENSVPQAFEIFEAHTGRPMMMLGVDKYVGLVLVDGLSGAEERLMERIGDLTDVLFVGGSAGDDMAFQATYVCANGQAYTDAAVLALLKPRAGFEVLKTQSFCTLPQVIKATHVDETTRTVYEFDGQPARETYAAAIGVAPEEAGDQFMSHPVGLMVDDEPFVRSPQRFQDDAMVFFCNIREGMQLSLLESTDIVADTKALITSRQEALGNIAGLINFHCILRTIELKQRGQTEAYGQLFADIPTIGFSTYGEEYLGHINQTSTILLLK